MSGGVKHKSIVSAGLTIGLVVAGKIGELLEIEMKNGAHGSADGFGVERVDGGRDNGEVVIAKSGSAARDSAEITGIGWVNEHKMRRVTLQGGSWLAKFGDEKTVVFGAENIESFGILNDVKMTLAKLVE